MVRAELRRFGLCFADTERWALRGLDLEVRAGQHWAVIGPEGSGKSTLLLVLAGLLDKLPRHRVEGDLCLDGCAALAFEDPYLQLTGATFSCMEEVGFGLELRGVRPPEIRRRALAALARVGLEGLSLRHPLTLSGGEQQRLSLACGWVLEPDLLLLDQTSTHLDAQGLDLLDDLVKTCLGHSGAVVCAEPRPQAAARQADRQLALPSLVAGPKDLGPAVAVEAVSSLLCAPVGIELDEVAFAHTGGPELWGLSSFAVEPGGSLALLGPNGSGKTTLLRLLAGLIRPTDGTVLRDGRPIDAVPAWLLARRAQMCWQRPVEQFFRPTCLAEVMVGVRACGHGTAKARTLALEALERLQLSHLAASHPLDLGGGAQRLLALACALGPRLGGLLLDEPTAGLDLGQRETVVSALKLERRLGSTLVIATQDIEFASQMTDSAVILGGQTIRPHSWLEPNLPRCRGVGDGIVPGPS